MRNSHVRERHAIHIAMAHTRMLYDHSKMMSSAREYLINRIKTLIVRERELNFEISVLRNASSGDEIRELSIIGRGNRANCETCDAEDGTIDLDHSILR